MARTRKEIRALGDTWNETVGRVLGDHAGAAHGRGRPYPVYGMAALLMLSERYAVWPKAKPARSPWYRLPVRRFATLRHIH
jgi:hypothetical protein